MERFKLKNEKVSFGISWLCALLFFSCLHLCRADDNPSDSNLIEIQTNLAHSYGIQTESIVAMPLVNIKNVLENPPNIKNAIFREYDGAVYNKDHNVTVFRGTNYYRCGFASNGYCLAVGLADSDLVALSALGNVMGRFGATNWHASGSAIIFDDGISDSENVLGRNRSSLACDPLRLGVLPLLVGSVRFQNDSQFEAKDAIKGKIIKGKLIINNEQNVSGIEYKMEGFTGWSYIVTFLSDNSSFPLHRWASFSVGPTRTNLMGMTEISSIQVTDDALSDNYFNPSNWLSHSSPIPVVDAYIVKNQVMVKMDGQLVPATSEIIRSVAKIRVIQAIFILLAIIPIFLVVWHLKHKSK
jgi:hypothetical protein